MPGIQDINLKLVATLDSGSVAEQASQAGSQMAQAIERAFEGLGAKIAAMILHGVRSGVGEAIDFMGSRQGMALTQTQQQGISTTMARGGSLLDAYGTPWSSGQPQTQTGYPQPGFTTYGPSQGAAFTLQSPIAAATARASAAPSEEEEPWLSPSRRKMLSGVVGGAASFVSMAARIPDAMMRSEAAGAELDQLGARDMMRGNYQNVIARENLGGRERMQTRGELVEGTKILGQVGVAIAGILAAPFTGGASLLLSAGAIGKTAMDGFNFKSNVLSNVENQASAEQMRQAIPFQMAQSGRDTAIGAYRGAMSAGSTHFAPFMAGMGMDVGGMDLRSFAVRQGLTNDQFGSTMGQFAGMGGIMGSGPALGKEPDLLARAFSQMGQGFMGMPNVASGLVQGGSSQVDAIRQAADMFENAVAAGLDQSKIGDAMIRMGQRAASMGLGGDAAASSQERFSLGLSQMVHPGGTTDAQQQVAEQYAQHVSKGATGGYEGMVKYKAANEFLSKVGYKGKDRTSIAAMLGMTDNIDEEGLRKMGKRFPGFGAAMDGHEKELSNDAMTIRRGASPKYNQQYFGKTNGLIKDALETVGDHAPLSKMMEAMDIQDANIASGGAAQPHVDILNKKTPQLNENEERMKAAAVTTAASDAALVSAGLGTLSKQLPALSAAFEELLQRIKAIKLGDDQAGTSSAFDWLFATSPGSS